VSEVRTLTRQRRLDFEAAINFRDLAGYPAEGGRRTRWGMLFRADSLADLTEADIKRLHALDLKTLIDSRLPAERLSGAIRPIWAERFIGA